jgi:LCP family protein required for cell wall assembly
VSDPLLQPMQPPRPGNGGRRRRDRSQARDALDSHNAAPHDAAPYDDQAPYDDDAAVVEADDTGRGIGTPFGRRRAPGNGPRPGRHSAAQRVMLGIDVLVVLACFAGAVGLLIGKHVRESISAAPQATVTGQQHGVTVNSAGVFVGDPTATFPAADPQAENFLIVGDDSHACVSPNSPWASAADPARADLGQRSDTIMLVRIDPASNRAAILSFPRDLWVKIPSKGRSRINSAYRKGDYSLLAQTLFDNFGVTVDHYVQVDFCAFKTIVDAVGGVKVPFQYPARDTHVALNIDTTGCHTFSGDEALAYVRSRYYEYLDIDGKWKGDNAYDLGRISRQQDFLRRMFETALAKGVFNASVAKGLIDTLTKYVVVDQKLSINGMLQFLGVLKQVQPLGIPTYQIDATRLIVQNNDVLQAKLDSPNMIRILDLFRGKTSLSSATDASTTSSVPAETGTAADPTGGPTTVTTTAAATAAAAATGGSSGAGQATNEPVQSGKGIVPPPNIVC